MPTTRKRKRSHNDERDDEPMSEDEDGDVDPAQASRSGARGTVLITLRDAPPYSLWYRIISHRGPRKVADSVGFIYLGISRV